MKQKNKKVIQHSEEAEKGGDFDSFAKNSKSNDFSHIQPVFAKPLEVKVYNNGFDKALRAFRALVQKERVLSTYKERQSYEKPSDKKRRKRNEMRRKMLEVNSSRRSPKRHNDNNQE